MLLSPKTDQLIKALQVLPGVGPKSAQRMVLHLLERNRPGGLQLAAAVQDCMQSVDHCERCRVFTEEPICRLCKDSRRNAKILCIVEAPGDLMAVEQAGSYDGRYFVLMGRLSPIDGIGPAEIGIPQLLNIIEEDAVTEVILATGSTVEGEATAYYISEQLKNRPVQVSRIAHGIPMGGELEYVDGNTLAHALAGRQVIDND
ncbi:MAG: recombination mediator RecR [Pseudomonadales bacterium]|nr:recombination mediator RecR [Pseudomonadales bacterium]